LSAQRRRILSETTKYWPTRLELTVNKGKNLLEAMRSQGLNILSMCGGRGVCGKCRVIIRGQGPLTDPTETERTLLTELELAAGYRLACLTHATKTAGIQIAIPPESEETQQRLVVAGFAPQVRLAPAVMKLFVRLQPPTLKDTTADLERLTEALKKSGKLGPVDIGYNTLRELPGLLRIGNWQVTVSVFRRREIVSVEPGDKREHCYGFAIDIGTTKLAGYLVDLRRGRTVTTVSSLNPQAKFGADIISRITYAMRGEEAIDELNKCVISGINALVQEACRTAGITTREIVDLSVAGNTAMHQIFLKVSPRYLAQSPYPAALRRGLQIKADHLGLDVAPDSNVYLFPVIAGFVGGDAVADMIATEMHSSGELSMLIDIGTNAEIVLGNKDGLVACSCASGPAFEGAQIKHGMRASEGAIEKVWIDPRTLDISYKVIGGVKPVGMCGSAIVETVAEMLRTGTLDSRGRIQEGGDSWRIRGTDGMKEMVIVPKTETGIDGDIALTQSDVREIQLAKAAVYSGISILMRHMRVNPDHIKKVFLAGAFGTYIDPASARDIGMFPEIPLNRIQFVGNTAGSGARMALISSQTRELAESILPKVEYVELGADPEFQKEFVSAIDLPNARKGLFPTVERIIEYNRSSMGRRL